MIFYNFTQKEIYITIKFTAQTPTEDLYKLTSSYKDDVETYMINNAGTEISQKITLSPGMNTMNFLTDAPMVQTANDPRQMYFRIINFQIIE